MELLEDCDDYKQRCIDLTNENKKLKEEINKMKISIKKSNAEIYRQNEEKIKQMVRIDQLQAKINNFMKEKEIVELQGLVRIQFLNETIQHLNSIIKDKDSIISKLNEERKANIDFIRDIKTKSENFLSNTNELDSTSIATGHNTEEYNENTITIETSPTKANLTIDDSFAQSNSNNSGHVDKNVSDSQERAIPTNSTKDKLPVDSRDSHNNNDEASHVDENVDNFCASDHKSNRSGDHSTTTASTTTTAMENLMTGAGQNLTERVLGSVNENDNKNKRQKKEGRFKPSCQIPNCNKQVQTGKFCIRHGGGKRCAAPDCDKSAQGPTNFCIKHGGGKRCAAPDCDKSAQGPTNFCIRHGGGKRCAAPNCDKSARGGSNFCKSHGGGKCCTAPDCNYFSLGNSNFCKSHGGGKHCAKRPCPSPA